jgi:hypothetical protein
VGEWLKPGLCKSPAFGFVGSNPTWSTNYWDSSHKSDPSAHGNSRWALIQMITLIKLSSPGWEKNFETVAEFKAELYKHICGMCRRGAEEYGLPINERSLLVDMWDTACSCEYTFEDPDKMIGPLS